MGIIKPLPDAIHLENIPRWQCQKSDPWFLVKHTDHSAYERITFNAIYFVHGTSKMRLKPGASKDRPNISYHTDILLIQDFYTIQ